MTFPLGDSIPYSWDRESAPPSLTLMRPSYNPTIPTGWPDRCPTSVPQWPIHRSLLHNRLGEVPSTARFGALSRVFGNVTFGTSEGEKVDFRRILVLRFWENGGVERRKPFCSQTLGDIETN